MLSDRLLRDLSPKRAELVVLHEIAHVKARHNLKLLLLSICLSSTCVFSYWALATTSSWSLKLGLILIAAWAGIRTFGRLARLFELQADRWAARKSGDPLEYLRAIADVASGHPDRATLMHPSFHQRCEFILNGGVKSGEFLQNEFRKALCFMGIWMTAVTAIGAGIALAW